MIMDKETFLVNPNEKKKKRKNKAPVTLKQ